jgi:S-(hydroxymethyl)glutathione dehydrogenase/alcohol dehydrogenase
MATGICHTDAYTLDGFDSEGIFPVDPRHESRESFARSGPGVTACKPGDHVIPLVHARMRQV